MMTIIRIEIMTIITEINLFAYFVLCVCCSGGTQHLLLQSDRKNNLKTRIKTEIRM